MTKSSLEKRAANPNSIFKHTNSLIIPGVYGGEKGINNNQKLYAVIFFVKIENDIISIHIHVYKVKQTKHNKYIVKKTIITKDKIVEQKHSVKSLTNDMSNGNFGKIQLPHLQYILDLIPGAVGSGKAPKREAETLIISVPTQELDLYGASICA
jgi:hypothetical protein